VIFDFLASKEEGFNYQLIRTHQHRPNRHESMNVYGNPTWSCVVLVYVVCSFREGKEREGEAGGIGYVCM
jgi:hypothetical protein